ncbi:hypothetical protein I4300191C4_14780 [Solibaculum mannosilyticum]|nr:hypothetical protein BN3661_00501 [Eubacteriaceae bacterium CHKCI005]
MKKRLTVILLAVTMIVLLFTSCQKRAVIDVSAEMGEGVSVNGNNLIAGGFAKLEDKLFFINGNGGIVCYMDLDTGEIFCNCNDPTCQHRLISCTAFISDNLSGAPRRIGTSQDGMITATESEVIKFTPGEKEVLASAKGNYGALNSMPYLFEDKMAVLTKDKRLVVQTIADEKELLAVENTARPLWGGRGDLFYYDGYLYLVRLSQSDVAKDLTDDPTGELNFNAANDSELIRVSVETGEVEQLIPSNVINISIYGDKIYYKQGSGSGNLMRANLDGSNPELVQTDVNLYNIKDDTIYYSSKEMGDFMSCTIHGENPTRLLQLGDLGYDIRGIYLFSDFDKIVLMRSDEMAFYTVNTDGSDLQLHEMPDFSNYE